MIDRRLNSAGRLADIFVTSKLTLLFMLACALFGVLAVTLTPREENPQIVVPGAEVRVLVPGASAEEVEELVIRPLEGIVKQIPGVDHTYATAVNSMGVLMVQFKVGEDKEKSLVKLYDRVLGQRDRLPTGAGDPLIRSVEVDDVPIVTVTLVAMAAIPLGLAGIFPGHWLMGQPFTATSMIGIIALAGVVVRNSLLIIDFVLDYRRQGMDLREAILEAGAVRLRPILLTALAIVLGSAVMLTDPVFSGLAISLIFGTLASTVLTLIVVPLLLYLLLRYKQQKEAAMGKGTL